MCRIDSLSGYNSGAILGGRGWIEQRPDDYAMDIVLTGEDLMLDEQLRGSLGPEMRAAWRRLAPRGRVDVEAHLVKAFGADEKLKHHVWVTPRDMRATLDVFPYPLDWVTGRLEFEGSEVRLRDVKARNGPTEFLLGGSIRYGKDGPEATLDLAARALRLEGAIRRAVPEPLRNMMDRFSATGRVDMDHVRITYKPTGPGTFESSWKGSALLDEVSFSPGLRISGVVGTADIEGRWTQAGLGLVTRLWIQQGKVAEKAVSDLRLTLEKAETSSIVVSPNIEGSFYGGRIEGSASVSLAESGRYGLTLSAAGVDFEQLLREGFHVEQNISGGKLRATLAVSGKGAQPDEVQASGYIEVTEAQLYELPFFVRLLNALRLAPADETAFEQARIVYFVRGKKIILEDIRLQGRALDLYGAGTLDPTGQLHLTFITGKKNERPMVPALAELMEGLRKEIALVEVTGTLAEPHVETKTLSGLTAPLRELVALVQQSRKARGAR
jgi:hypothetical protein